MEISACRQLCTVMYYLVDRNIPAPEIALSEGFIETDKNGSSKCSSLSRSLDLTTAVSANKFVDQLKHIEHWMACKTPYLHLLPLSDL